MAAPRIGAGLERSAEQDRVVAARELAVELAREPGDRASEDGTPSTSSCGTPASFSSPLAFVAKRRAISSWSAASTLMQKRPELRTAASVFEP